MRFANAIDVLNSLPSPPRVLVVEDNATNQLVARSVLAKFGIAPDIAGNGLEAVAAIQRAPYDVVLMDVHMPEMDGLEATRAIRALPDRCSRTPIVALTANAFESDVDVCRSAGMNGHVGKPFRREELLIAIIDAITGKLSFAGQSAQTPSQVQSVPAIDWSVIERFRADSGDEMLHLLIDTYVSEAAGKVAMLGDMLRRGDTSEEAIRLAHALKSASAMAGAAALAGLSADVERALTLRSRTVGADEAREMQEQFDAYRAALVAQGYAA
jgi:CheY-like chemotaxis protein/HPt (histidine-containing phosphotransfer) domain-containing protein